jgi:hypothetical protein
MHTKTYVNDVIIVSLLFNHKYSSNITCFLETGFRLKNNNITCFSPSPAKKKSDRTSHSHSPSSTISFLSWPPFHFIPAAGVAPVHCLPATSVEDCSLSWFPSACAGWRPRQFPFRRCRELAPYPASSPLSRRLSPPLPRCRSLSACSRVAAGQATLIEAPTLARARPPPAARALKGFTAVAFSARIPREKQLRHARPRPLHLSRDWYSSHCHLDSVHNIPLFTLQ